MHCSSAAKDTKEGRRTPFINGEQSARAGPAQRLYYLSLVPYHLNIVIKLKTKQTSNINHESINVIRRHDFIIHRLSHLERYLI